MKTRLDKAMNNEWSDDSNYDNINKSIELAKNINIIDIIDPTTKIRHDLAEIVSRLKNAENLEIIDIQDFTGNIHSYS
tara:strand:+ start:276 stop:509 length:234 start_codon:yes stop_codon:yes gene_type:complete